MKTFKKDLQNIEKPLGVSIICCTFNGRLRLPATFKSITQLDYKNNWEFILVDNDSNDGTSDYAEKFFNSTSIDLQILHCEKPGKNFALWMAFEAVKYRYILICDDDNELSPDYLSVGTVVLESNPKIGTLGGTGYLPKSIEKPEWFDRYQSTYAIGPQASKNGSLPNGVGVYGAGCFIREAGIRKLLKSGFKLISQVSRGKTLSGGEDIEICLALECLGYNSWYDNRLKFIHHLEKHRFELSYFYQLIASIAKSSPKIEAYKYHLNKDKSGFLIHLLKKLFNEFLMFIFTNLLFILKPKFKNQVFKIVYWNRFVGSFTSFRPTLNTYKSLKIVFN